MEDLIDDPTAVSGKMVFNSGKEPKYITGIELKNSGTANCSSGYHKDYDSYLKIPSVLPYNFDNEHINEYPSKFEIDIYLNRSHLSERMQNLSSSQLLSSTLFEALNPDFNTSTSTFQDVTFSVEEFFQSANESFTMMYNVDEIHQ